MDEIRYEAPSAEKASVLNDQWLQDTAYSMKLPALNPHVCSILLPIIEAQTKKIAQQAHKFQRRSKSTHLTVQDINLSLQLNKIECIYGLSERNGIVDGNLNNSDSSDAIQFNSIVALVDYVKTPLPLSPLKPEVSMHWLAVNGVQPLICENPTALPITFESDLPLSLPKETQVLFSRITGIILASESSPALSVVFKVLRSDAGLQDILPYFCRFFYQQIKANTRRLPLLKAIMSCIKSLLQNPNVSFQYHLPQILPAVFTCIIGPKLSSNPMTEDHWGLRTSSAGVINIICVQYSETNPDLFARICKTFTDALGDDKSLPALYGGIVGLCALGQNAVKALLLPQLNRIQSRLTPALREQQQFYQQDTSASNIGIKVSKSTEIGSEHCRQAILDALGKYVLHSLRSSSTAESTASFTTKGPPLVGLEEALVPYFSTASRQDYYCRLFL